MIMEAKDNAHQVEVTFNDSSNNKKLVGKIISVLEADKLDQYGNMLYDSIKLSTKDQNDVDNDVIIHRTTINSLVNLTNNLKVT